MFLVILVTLFRAPWPVHFGSCVRLFIQNTKILVKTSEGSQWSSFITVSYLDWYFRSPTLSPTGVPLPPIWPKIMILGGILKCFLKYHLKNHVCASALLVLPGCADSIHWVLQHWALLLSCFTYLEGNWGSWGGASSKLDKFSEVLRSPEISSILFSCSHHFFLSFMQKSFVYICHNR